MSVKKKEEKIPEATILKVNKGVMRVRVVGDSPLIFNAMSEKARHELLLPKGKPNAAERAARLKHEPFDEFRNSVYLQPDPKAPTHLAALSSWFKQAMANAALDMPDAKKSQIGRLTWIPGERVSLYGIPRISCMIVRSADMNKTPDVRTRALLREWCAEFRVTYMTPLIREQVVANLLAVAGMTNGVGDYRQQKGSGSYGQFRCVEWDDPEWARIAKEGGRKAQEAAMANPDFHDEETERLLSWFVDEVKRRGAPRTNGKAAPEEFEESAEA